MQSQVTSEMIRTEFYAFGQIRVFLYISALTFFWLKMRLVTFATLTIWPMKDYSIATVGFLIDRSQTGTYPTDKEQ